MCDNVSGVVIRAALLQRLDLLVGCVQQVRWAGGGRVTNFEMEFCLYVFATTAFFPSCNHFTCVTVISNLLTPE